MKKSSMPPTYPAKSLETVHSCPVCGASSRRLLYKDLEDWTFFCTSGKWSVFICQSCHSAHLNPRLNRDSIGLAYHNYVTHETAPKYESLGFLGKFQYKLANGYRNHRYGTNDLPASPMGILAAALMPKKKAIIDAGMRHLPKIKGGGCLLDIGCGNCMFLKRSRDAGWSVIGVDTDPVVVKRGREYGLEVYLGGIDVIEKNVRFDVVTLAHVIEHVHDPRELLSRCFNLLTSDGYLWIETPNISSIGHQLFTKNWRGLEAPRHLTLFNLKSLTDCLESIGFTKIQIQPYRQICDFMFSSSLAIANNKDPYSVPLRYFPQRLTKRAEKIARCYPSRREFITLKAWKK